jgi:DNA repair exonuclease SbcCD ATPase subunit
MNFNLFPKKKSVDEILETNEVLYDSIKKEANDLVSGVVNGVYEIIALKNELQHQLDENAKLNLQVTALHKIIEGGKESIDKLKKDVEDQKQLKDSLQRVNEKYIKKITEQSDKIILLENAIERWHSRSKEWEKMDEEIQSTVSELTKEVIGLRHLKNENVELIDRLKNETQKHPMYPLHWGGYDKNIIDFVESEFSNEDPLEGKQVEFNAEELLKRVNEYADFLDTLPKSFPDEFQKEKSWEDAASDLALRVVKLEKKVEELTTIKFTSDPNYKYFLEHGKWPYSAMNPDGTLKTIPC